MRIRNLMGGLCMLLVVVFVGIIPTIIDVQHMPTGGNALPHREVHVESWPAWPAHLAGGSNTTPALRQMYEQVATFANRSLYAMDDLERTIAQVKKGDATSNRLYLAARAAGAAAADERDALMGLVLSPEAKSSQWFTTGWRDAQLASLAKVHAMEILQSSAGSRRPWEQPEYLQALHDARDQTARALRLMARCVQPLPRGGM